MCLLITQTKPYNNKKIRYKILERNERSFRSPYRYIYWKNKSHCANSSYRYPIEAQAYKGIHVFDSFKDALFAFKKSDPDYDSETILVSLEVDGFLGAGKHIHFSEWGNGMKGEVWNKAKIKKVLRVKSYFSMLN